MAGTSRGGTAHREIATLLSHKAPVPEAYFWQDVQPRRGPARALPTPSDQGGAGELTDDLRLTTVSCARSRRDAIAALRLHVMPHPSQRCSRRRGQSLVEMSLVLPAFLLLVSGCIDFGRYMYIESTITTNALNAVRGLTLPAYQAKDCLAQTTATYSPGGFTLTVDTASHVGDTGSDYTTPTTDGLTYIYPAAAPNPWSSGTCDTGANRTGQGVPPSVLVRITYVFKPWTPVISTIVGSKTITVVAKQPTEY